jgi:SAM-dependent methyltransferase
MTDGPDQDAVDARIQAYYGGEFEEGVRLTTRSAHGRLEHERTQELVRALVPPGSRVLDVGGATGIHAASVAAAGYQVRLLDPVPAQVETARAHGTFPAEVGDARDLPSGDDAFDAALLLGPLYHLATRADRLRALAEAARVVRPDGYVFAAAIPRVARHAAVTLARDVPHPYPSEWLALLEHGTPDPAGRFPGAHFHTGEELEAELADAGLDDVRVVGIEGPGGLALEELTDPPAELYAAALTLARAVGDVPGVRDLSNHLLGIGRVPNRRGGLEIG